MTASSGPPQLDFVAHLLARDGMQMYVSMAAQPDADGLFVRVSQPPAGGDPEVVLVREPQRRWVVRADREENRLYLNLSVLDLEDTDDPAVRDVILDVGASVLFHLRVHVGAPDEALAAPALAASDRPLKMPTR